MKRIFTFLFLGIYTSSYCQLAFYDSATAAGVGESYGTSYLGGGISFLDFDGDGWDDLTYATTDGEEVYFFRFTIEEGEFTKKVVIY